MALGETKHRMLYIALLIFALTVVFVIWQPKGLGIGWSAAGGALIALLCGVVTLGDVFAVTQMVWNATLAFVGIILISLVLDEIGFFEWAALKMARAARGNGRLLFVYIVLLGAAVSAFFANDGAALILTPIVLAKVQALKFDRPTVVAFAMAGGFIADTASIPLVTSNLTNIVSTDFFGIGFIEYAARMVVPNFVSIAASLLVLCLFFRKHIPDRYDLAELKRPEEAIKDGKLFRLAWVVLGVLFVAYLTSEFTAIPISLITGLAALALIATAQRRKAVEAKSLMADAPWRIVVFSIGMYVVVYGLRNVGLTDALGRLIETICREGMFAATVGVGFIAAALCSVMNNLPTLMINVLAIDGASAEGVLREALIYANVVGSNPGTKMTPIGSLATLLWLHVLARKDVKITWGYYIKSGIVLTVPTLFVTLAGLYLWLKWAYD